MSPPHARGRVNKVERVGIRGRERESSGQVHVLYDIDALETSAIADSHPKP